MSGNLITTSNIQPNFKLVNVQIFSRNCSKLSTEIKQFLKSAGILNANVTKKDSSCPCWMWLVVRAV